MKSLPHTGNGQNKQNANENMSDQDYERIAFMIIDAVQYTQIPQATLYVYLSKTDFTNTFQIQRTQSVDTNTQIRTKTILEYSYVGKDIHISQIVACLEKHNYPPAQWEVSYAHPMGKNMPHNPPTYFFTFSPQVLLSSSSSSSLLLLPPPPPPYPVDPNPPLPRCVSPSSSKVSTKRTNTGPKSGAQI